MSASAPLEKTAQEFFEGVRELAALFVTKEEWFNPQKFQRYQPHITQKPYAEIGAHLKFFRDIMLKVDAIIFNAPVQDDGEPVSAIRVEELNTAFEKLFVFLRNTAKSFEKYISPKMLNANKNIKRTIQTMETQVETYFKTEVEPKRIFYLTEFANADLSKAERNRDADMLRKLKIFAQTHNMVDILGTIEQILTTLDKESRDDEDVDLDNYELPEALTPRVMSPEGGRKGYFDDDDEVFEPIDTNKQAMSPGKKVANMTPGPEMDNMVAILVMEWKTSTYDENIYTDHTGKDTGWRAKTTYDDLPSRGVWRPSSSMDCAWKVIQHLARKDVATVRISNSTVEFKAKNGRLIGRCDCDGKRVRMPLAVCRAAVAAMNEYVEAFTNDVISRYAGK